MNDKIITLEEFVENIAREMLYVMTVAVRKETMTLEEVQKVAKEFMKGYPADNIDAFLQAVYESAKDYSFLVGVYAKYKGIYEDDKTQKRLTTARKFMQQEEFDLAVSAMKGEVYV